MAKRRILGEGGIDQLPSGSYRARINEKTGRTSRAFLTKSEALDWLAHMRLKISDGSFISPSDVTFMVWWNYWFETYKLHSVTGTTIKTYYATRKRLPEELFGKKLSEITTYMIQTALNQLSSAGLSRRTVEITRTHLSMCLSRAVIEKLIHENPVKATTLPARVPGRKSAVLSRKEVSQLAETLRYISGKDRTLRDCLFLILHTGMRCSEAINLKWLDLSDEKIHVRGTKTEGSDRYIPLCAVTAEMFQRRALDEHTPKDFIFQTKNGKVILRRNLLRKMNSLTGHSIQDLRHTYATRAAEIGVNPKVLQLLLGHSEISTTLKYYTHITTATLAEAAEKIIAE